MNTRAAVVVGALTTFLMGPATLAQMTMQPTSRPIVTADNEAWYVAGAPITFGGITYYPAGPMVHFNGNEMVRSGHFQGVPLYSRTTIEPYSLVFVPIGGGLMHPYERRREGDVAGTVGSVTPSFPVVRPVEQAATMEFVPGAGMVQAQAPPSQVGEAVDRIALAEIPQTPASALVGTTGAGLNTIYIVYGTQRFYADGPAVEFDEKVFTRIGEYHGVSVYRHKGQDRTVYLSPRGGKTEVVAPYRAR
jgi:hypothetical protein